MWNSNECILLFVEQKVQTFIMFAGFGLVFIFKQHFLDLTFEGFERARFILTVVVINSDQFKPFSDMARIALDKILYRFLQWEGWDIHWLRI